MEAYYQLTVSQLPTIYQANYLLPSTAEQQIQDYRITSTHTAWWPLTSRGRQINVLPQAELFNYGAMAWMARPLGRAPGSGPGPRPGDCCEHLTKNL